jgi:hypothetical protein
VLEGATLTMPRRTATRVAHAAVRRSSRTWHPAAIQYAGAGRRQARIMGRPRATRA